MPTYQITAPNGRTYRIDGPAGATDEQVRARVMAQHPEAGAAPFAETRKALSVIADTAASFLENVSALPDLAATGMGKAMGLTARTFGASPQTVAALENPFTLGGNLRSRVPEQAGNVVPRSVSGAFGGLFGGNAAGGLLMRVALRRKTRLPT